MLLRQMSNLQSIESYIYTNLDTSLPSLFLLVFLCPVRAWDKTSFDIKLRLLLATE